MESNKELTDAMRAEAGEIDRLIDDCLGVMLDAGKENNFIQLTACGHEFDKYYQMMRRAGVSPDTLTVYHQIFEATLYEALDVPKE